MCFASPLARGHSEWVLAYLVEGAQERGLPESWVAHLRQQVAEMPQPPAGRVGLRVEQKQKP